MAIIVGSYTPEWGHTALAEGFDKLYALRSLPGGSSLCVFDVPEKTDGFVSLGRMTPVGEFKTPGEHSCHITLLDSQAVVSDYTSGTLSLFELDGEGIPQGEPSLIRFRGAGPDPIRQTCPHIHSSWVSPDGETIVVADLGCDRLYRYKVSDGRLQAQTQEVFCLPEGCGPRHCVFSACGKRLYVSTELSDEVLVYDYPQMKLVQSLLVNDLKPRGGGHLAISPDGKFLYASSRLKNDGLAIFQIDADGLLQRVGYQPTGEHPRHFTISEDGKTLLCAARDSDLIEAFSVNSEDGKLLKKEEFNIDKPVFILTLQNE